MSPVELAAGDVVGSWSEVDAGGREPLVVLDALGDYLDRVGLGSGKVLLEPIGDGRSNVTLAVSRGESTYVLRRPPRGTLAAGAHDILREARILASIEGAARVPRVLAVCDEPTVIGAPFFVMERVEGTVISSEVPVALDSTEGRRGIGEQLVDVLVEVHRTDWRGCGLSHREGYLARQLQRFAATWDRVRSRDVPAVARVGEWLVGNQPPESEPTLVHGDYRLGNVILAPGEEPRIAAVLDWEMATVGDPLADLGYLTSLWPSPSDGPVEGLEEVAALPAGLPSREEIVERYARGSGRDTTEIEWHRALALWKAAIFMESNFVRAGSGTGDEWHLATFEAVVPILGEQAEQICRNA